MGPILHPAVQIRPGADGDGGFAAGTTIPARGFVWFTETQMGYRLNAAGETIYFKNTNGVVLDALKFGAQENGISLCRQPDGAAEWVLTVPTDHAANVTAGSFAAFITLVWSGGDAACTD